MSELVLYRKYRPADFEEVVGQEHVVSAIQNAVRLDRVAHAYLFSGPRGVGKTTIARLLAKSLNCANLSKISERNFDDKSSIRRSLSEGGLPIPCNQCDFCKEFSEGRAQDLIEIDAASTNGVDDVRELREAVRFVPSQGKFKTYIVDECHMLSKGAFNALLKMLEEPPAHAVFVLATTELEKVPATIVSRTQHYRFRRPTVTQICARLADIAEKEGVQLDDDAGRIIAYAAEGGLRDAESILGQIMAVADKKIERKNAEEVLGIPPREAIKKLFIFVAEKKLSDSLVLVQELHDQGYDMSSIARLMMHYFRSALFLKTSPTLQPFVAGELLSDELECISANLPHFSEKYLTRAVNAIFQNIQSFKRTPIPQLPLELALVELISAIPNEV